MVKIVNFMKILLLILLFLSTDLSASFNTITKAIVKKSELRLTFSKSFSKRNIKHFTLLNPKREVYDLNNVRMAHSRIPLGLGSNVRIAQNSKNKVRIVIEGYKRGVKPISYQPMLMKKEYRIALPKDFVPKRSTADIAKHKNKKEKKSYKNRGHKNQLIVIDAGHGGHDGGAVGGRKREKDLVLMIAKKTAKALKKLGYSVYLTRSSDRFLKLSQRTHIADRKKSVAFISIHANSVPKRKRKYVHGIETYFLQNTRDAKSQRIAARENRAVLKGAGNRLSKNVIIDSVLNGPKIVQSNKLAIDVQRRIITNLRAHYKWVKDAGVRHAPFYVLVGASRPSILVEVGYISHPRERKRLFTSNYQNLIAKGIAQGVSNYLNNRKKEIDF